MTRANAGNALIGRVTEHTITATPYHQTVNFTMKHVAAKVKVKLTGDMKFSGIAATLASVNATDVPSSSIYDASTGTWSLGTGAATTDNLTYGASQQGPMIPHLGSPQVATATEDAFFMPSTDVSKLKLTFTAGTIYNQNMTNTSLTFAPKTPLQLDQNGSYVLNVNLTYRYLYLMSDGTTGFIDKTTFGGAPAATAKTPVAVVVSQSKRMAVALKDADNGVKMKWTTELPYIDGYYYTVCNTHPVSSVKNALTSQATSGLDETWNASYSTVGVKANNANMLPFYAAAHYDPGVTYTGTPALQWYLPSLSDYDVLLSSLGFTDHILIIDRPHMQNYSYYRLAITTAFTQVGGTTICKGGHYNYWTSTEFRLNDNRTYAGYVKITGAFNFTYQAKDGHYGDLCYVRPFVKY